MSLLGKPLNYTRAHRNARSRRQGLIYNFLERPRGWAAFLYHTMVFLMVFFCLGLSIFSTIEAYQDEAVYILYHMEVIVVLWLSIEFVIRLWASGCRSRYQGFVGRLKFITQTFCIVDIITIAASTIALILGAPGRVFATSTLRGLRYFQILRMLRMDRRGGSWKLLGSVVYAHRQELLTTVYIGFLGLICAAFSVYIVERDVNEQFRNFPQSLWWGVVTLCTIGYGDVVPVTWQGKLISSIATLLTYSFFALPAGILGSGFALKVQQQQRQKHMISRYQPAAMLMQAVWRCYAADEQSTSVATWKIHEVHIKNTTNSPKYNGYFATRLPTIRRPRNVQTLQTPHVDIVNVESQPLQQHRPLKYTPSIMRDNAEDEFFPPHSRLTNQHKIAIRFIRTLKYLVARRKFKEALKPYDVKDVMEQYAAGHADLLARVKNIHARLDLVVGGKRTPKLKDSSKVCLTHRMVNVERQVTSIEDKLDFLIRAYVRDHEVQALNEHDKSLIANLGRTKSNQSLKTESGAVATTKETPKNALLERLKKSDEKAISSSCEALHKPENSHIRRPRHNSVTSGEVKEIHTSEKRRSLVTFVDETGGFEEPEVFSDSDLSRYPSSDLDTDVARQSVALLQVPQPDN